ncbi:MAG: hypothetical protein FWE63_02125 [Bacteroidales bacterium]|nr:hypothetical protein [Bacteroidales bacterium]
MKKLFFISTLFVGSIFFTSCNKNEILKISEEAQKTIDLAKFQLPSFDKSMSMSEEVQIVLSRKDLGLNEQENELRRILEPQINLGKELHTEILAIIEADPTISLTEAEYSEILDLMEEHFAELAVLVAIIADDPYRGSVMTCLGLAVGILQLGEFLAGTITAQTAIAIIKQVGKRYLGWIGLGIMIYEFVTCLD